MREMDGAQQRQAKLRQDMQDTLVVMAAIQKRQADVQKDQAASITRLHKSVNRLSKSFTRLSLKVDELADKLNGVVGYLDNLPRNPPQ